MEFKPGLKIGKLTLIKFLGRNKHSKKQWLCKCDCGNTCVRIEGNLKTTPVPHCGCSPAWKGFNKRFTDLSGQKFGRLTVRKFYGKDKYSHNLWLCDCECGGVAVVDTSALTGGKTTSCGCWQIESTIQRSSTHGKTHERLYRIYAHMKDRCYLSTSKTYADYGGRGVTICNEWLNDFQAFYDWAIANGYNDDLTIDRIDVNGNYEPSNCRWATMKEQANNRRITLKHTYKGITHTLPEWEEITGINYAHLYVAYRHGKGDLDRLLDKYTNK